MVQFKRPVYDPYSQHRDYWKLTPAVAMRAFLIEYLTNKGIKFPKGLSKARLSCISVRAQRGLMVYDSRGVSELRNFASNRKLDIADLARCKKWDLIAHLEKADEDATFTLFEDLPAELRVHIYEVYLQDFEEELVIPVQPPISKVSRLLRKESLPLFYQICRFEAIALSGGSPDPATQNFFSRAPIAVLEKIRALHVTGGIYFRNEREIYITFILKNAGDGVKITDPLKDINGATISERHLEVFKERMRKSGIQDRDEKLRLRRSDIDALAKVFMPYWDSD